MLTGQIQKFFQQLSADRRALAMHAEVIQVRDKGRIVESRTHARLIALGEAYAASWLAQIQEATHA